jgi:hypothetical protein
MYKLYHDDPRCTGWWERGPDAERLRWECTRCGAAYADTREVSRAAEAENYMGVLLVSLEMAGREML